MKNFLTNLMTATALLCTLGGALEAQTYQAAATVPFGWQANGHQFPAGKYTINKEESSPVLSIRNEHGKGTFLMTGAASGSDTSPRMVFHRYGDHYFLAEVWAPGAIGSKVRTSSAEKETIAAEKPRQMSTVQVAIN
jgi:hypothetical protein